MAAVIRSYDYYDFMGESFCLTSDVVQEANANFFFTANIDASMMSERVVTVSYVYTHEIATICYQKMEGAMRVLLKYDLQDVPVMLGAATFVGSLAGVAWGATSASSTPVGLTISAAVIGLLLGRIVSEKAKVEK
ncbi:hypothetical protein [Pseudomonas tolaasii]|uniref:hypothetical protein n=1 Tax=Pseudomonas tolaasii TaxID=29442 RepID=UPI0015A1B901|nr:hypothetical protein [Pseudomonas tolaasii]NWC38378.1 hypothetical protein [Pseudomonas tolaasii]